MAGIPRPQGSQRMITTRDGRAIGLSAPSLPEWRNAMVVEFRRVAAEGKWRPPSGPLEVWCLFTFPRPKSHTLKRRASDGGLKPDGPDLDKLLRAAFDALEVAGILGNDRQIVGVTAHKVYGEDASWPAGLDVTVTEVASVLELRW